jgi:hypothetical protein
MHNCNFTVFLHGYGTWCLALKEEHRLMVFENTVLRIFGPELGLSYSGSTKCPVRDEAPILGPRA